MGRSSYVCSFLLVIILFFFIDWWMRISIILGASHITLFQKIYSFGVMLCVVLPVNEAGGPRISHILWRRSSYACLFLLAAILTFFIDWWTRIFIILGGLHHIIPKDIFFWSNVAFILLVSDNVVSRDFDDYAFMLYMKFFIPRY